MIAKKGITIGLILALCLPHGTAVIGAQPVTPAWVERLRPPVRFGTVSQYFDPAPTGNSEKSPLIIHIQNLHYNQKVQKNIAGLLRFLTKELSPNGSTAGLPFRIAVEGASKTLDYSELVHYPFPQWKKPLADFLLKHGELTGAEYFAILANEPRLYGIEDPTYYAYHLQLVRESYDRRARIEGQLEELAKILDTMGHQMPANTPAADLERLAAARREVDLVRSALAERLVLDDVRKVIRHLPKLIWLIQGLSPAMPTTRIPSPQDLDEALRTSVDYYAAAILRDQPLAGRSAQLLRELEGRADAPKTLVVITGGFHTKGITQQWHDQGIRHLVIQPNVTSHTAEDEALYTERLLGHHVSLDTIKREVGDPNRLEVIGLALTPQGRLVWRGWTRARLAKYRAHYAFRIWREKAGRRLYAFALKNLVMPLMPLVVGGMPGLPGPGAMGGGAGNVSPQPPVQKMDLGTLFVTDDASIWITTTHSDIHGTEFHLSLVTPRQQAIRFSLGNDLPQVGVLFQHLDAKSAIPASAGLDGHSPVGTLKDADSGGQLDLQRIERTDGSLARYRLVLDHPNLNEPVVVFENDSLIETAGLWRKLSDALGAEPTIVTLARQETDRILAEVGASGVVLQAIARPGDPVAFFLGILRESVEIAMIPVPTVLDLMDLIEKFAGVVIPVTPSEAEPSAEGAADAAAAKDERLLRIERIVDMGDLTAQVRAILEAPDLFKEPAGRITFLKRQLPVLESGKRLSATERELIESSVKNVLSGAELSIKEGVADQPLETTEVGEPIAAPVRPAAGPRPGRPASTRGQLPLPGTAEGPNDFEPLIARIHAVIRSGDPRITKNMKDSFAGNISAIRRRGRIPDKLMKNLEKAEAILRTPLPGGAAPAAAPGTPTAHPAAPSGQAARVSARPSRRSRIAAVQAALQRWMDLPYDISRRWPRELDDAFERPARVDEATLEYAERFLGIGVPPLIRTLDRVVSGDLNERWWNLKPEDQRKEVQQRLWNVRGRYSQDGRIPLHTRRWVEQAYDLLHIHLRPADLAEGTPTPAVAQPSTAPLPSAYDAAATGIPPVISAGRRLFLGGFFAAAWRAAGPRDREKQQNLQRQVLSQLNSYRASGVVSENAKICVRDAYDFLGFDFNLAELILRVAGSRIHSYEDFERLCNEVVEAIPTTHWNRTHKTADQVRERFRARPTTFLIDSLAGLIRAKARIGKVDPDWPSKRAQWLPPSDQPANEPPADGPPTAARRPRVPAGPEAVGEGGDATVAAAREQAMRAWLLGRIGAVMRNRGYNDIKAEFGKKFAPVIAAAGSGARVPDTLPKTLKQAEDKLGIHPPPMPTDEAALQTAPPPAAVPSALVVEFSQKIGIEVVALATFNSDLVDFILRIAGPTLHSYVDLANLYKKTVDALNAPNARSWTYGKTLEELMARVAAYPSPTLTRRLEGAIANAAGIRRRHSAERAAAATSSTRAVFDRGAFEMRFNAVINHNRYDQVRLADRAAFESAILGQLPHEEFLSRLEDLERRLGITSVGVPLAIRAKRRLFGDGFFADAWKRRGKQDSVTQQRLQRQVMTHDTGYRMSGVVHENAETYVWDAYAFLGFNLYLAELIFQIAGSRIQSYEDFERLYRDVADAIPTAHFNEGRKPAEDVLQRLHNRPSPNLIDGLARLIRVKARIGRIDPDWPAQRAQWLTPSAQSSPEPPVDRGLAAEAVGQETEPDSPAARAATVEETWLLDRVKRVRNHERFDDIRSRDGKYFAGAIGLRARGRSFPSTLRERLKQAEYDLKIVPPPMPTAETLLRQAKDAWLMGRIGDVMRDDRYRDPKLGIQKRFGKAFGHEIGAFSRGHRIAESLAGKLKQSEDLLGIVPPPAPTAETASSPAPAPTAQPSDLVIEFSRRIGVEVLTFSFLSMNLFMVDLIIQIAGPRIQSYAEFERIYKEVADDIPDASWNVGHKSVDEVFQRLQTLPSPSLRGSIEGLIRAKAHISRIATPAAAPAPMGTPAGNPAAAAPSAPAPTPAPPGAAPVVAAEELDLSARIDRLMARPLYTTHVSGFDRNQIESARARLAQGKEAPSDIEPLVAYKERLLGIVTPPPTIRVIGEILKTNGNRGVRLAREHSHIVRDLGQVLDHYWQTGEISAQAETLLRQVHELLDAQPDTTPTSAPPPPTGAPLEVTVLRARFQAIIRHERYDELTDGGVFESAVQGSRNEGQLWRTLEDIERRLGIRTDGLPPAIQRIRDIFADGPVAAAWAAATRRVPFQTQQLTQLLQQIDTIYLRTGTLPEAAQSMVDRANALMADDLADIAQEAGGTGPASGSATEVMEPPDRTSVTEPSRAAAAPAEWLPSEEEVKAEWASRVAAVRQHADIWSGLGDQERGLLEELEEGGGRLIVGDTSNALDVLRVAEALVSDAAAQAVIGEQSSETVRLSDEDIFNIIDEMLAPSFPDRDVLQGWSPEMPDPSDALARALLFYYTRRVFLNEDRENLLDILTRVQLLKRIKHLRANDDLAVQIEGILESPELFWGPADLFAELEQDLPAVKTGNLVAARVERISHDVAAILAEAERRIKEGGLPERIVAVPDGGAGAPEASALPAIMPSEPGSELTSPSVGQVLSETEDAIFAPLSQAVVLDPARGVALSELAAWSRRLQNARSAEVIVLVAHEVLERGQAFHAVNGRLHELRRLLSTIEEWREEDGESARERAVNSLIHSLDEIFSFERMHIRDQVAAAHEDGVTLEQLNALAGLPANEQDDSIAEIPFLAKLRSERGQGSEAIAQARWYVAQDDQSLIGSIVDGLRRQSSSILQHPDRLINIVRRTVNRQFGLHLTNTHIQTILTQLQSLPSQGEDPVTLMPRHVLYSMVAPLILLAGSLSWTLLQVQMDAPATSGLVVTILAGWGLLVGLSKVVYARTSVTGSLAAFFRHLATSTEPLETLRFDAHGDVLRGRTDGFWTAVPMLAHAMMSHRVLHTGIPLLDQILTHNEAAVALFDHFTEPILYVKATWVWATHVVRSQRSRVDGKGVTNLQLPQVMDLLPTGSTREDDGTIRLPKTSTLGEILQRKLHFSPRQMVSAAQARAQLLIAA